MSLISMVISLIFLVGCSSAYYGTMEKLGYHKRDLMVSRVESARDAQQDAKEEFELKQTQRQYSQLIGAMKRAEKKMEPVLLAFHDQVLFLKHNLNARAIASLQTELVSVEAEVNSLIRDMEASIKEADVFIGTMAGE